MKKILLSILLVPLFGFSLVGEETASANAADFGFDFVGIKADRSGTTRNFAFQLMSTNRTLWTREDVPVTFASNGVFHVRLSGKGKNEMFVDDSNAEYVTDSDLATAIERVGSGPLTLTIADHEDSMVLDLPPTEIAGVAERALGASGNFNAAKGLVVPELTVASDVSAGRVIAGRLSSQTAVKTAGALAVKGNLQAKGTLFSQGPVTAKTLTVKDSVSVTSTLEAKKELAVGTVKGIKTLTVGKSLSVGGVNVAVPEGTIIAWNDTANIPVGWAICNGDNGTPNMRNRFVVGWGDGYVPGDQQKGYGGADSVQLTVKQMPSHRHRLPYYTGKIGDMRWKGNQEVRGISDEYKHTGNRTVGVSCGTSSKPSALGTAHENRPPYYALVFIMKKYGGAK